MVNASDSGSRGRGFGSNRVFLKPRSHSAGMAPVNPGGGQPVYRDEPGHFS